MPSNQQWTTGPLEYTLTRGKRIVAKVIHSDDGFYSYDQRYMDEREGLGRLMGGGLPTLEEAQARAEKLR